MSNVKKADGDTLYSLISLEDFKNLLSVDDRDDKMSRFCLITSTFTIEQYCRRKLCQKTIHQVFKEWQDFTVYLREYPVISMSNEQVTMSNGNILDPEYYRVIPDCGINENYPYSIVFSPEIKRMRDLKYINITYQAGYPCGEVPADLSSACLELAVWNMSRYKGKRIGEEKIPASVRELLEPYKRRVI